MSNGVKNKSGKPFILCGKVRYFLHKIFLGLLCREEMRDYRPAEIDSTNFKIPSLLEEPFARK